MKTKRFIFLLTLMIAVQSSYGQVKKNSFDTTLKNIDTAKAEIAKSLVTTYARLFFNGNNVDSLASLCSLPFSWDRQKVIDNWTDFKKEQQTVIEKKGKNRDVAIDTVFVAAIRREILDAVVPINIYYVILNIKFKIEGKEKKARAIFAVQINEQPKIVGISD